MSPEEFDNRLKSAFQDEYLQPKEQLWGNISSQLKPKAISPFGKWLLPAIISVTVGIALVVSQKPFTQKMANEPNNKQNAVEVDSTNYNASSAISTSQNSTENLQVQNSNAEVSRANNPLFNETRSNEVNTQNPIATRTSYQVSSENATTQRNPNQRTSNQRSSNQRNLNRALINNNYISAIENNLTGEFETISFNKFAWFPNFFKPYTLEELYSVDLKAKNTTINHNTNSNKPPKTSDFSSKRWFTLGLGPQLAINTIKMNQDSQAWVHKQLWDNKDRLTSNGSGFQAFGHLALKFGKNNRYIFETGLNYSLRTEEIKLNESSYDIAARDNNGKINQYTQILLKVIYGTDTTYYLAVTNFSLAVNNKYHILTVPFRLSAEHKISESTFMSYGLGGGFSMLSSHNTEHLNMIWGNSVKERNSTQFSASLNANLSLYTNFNDIGQIGVYTGLQMYLNPWKVNSNQYAINMRDMQLGITFRKPF